MNRSGLRYGICLALLFAFSTTAVTAAEFRLYDATLGGTPDTQSMIFQGAGGQSYMNGSTLFNTVPVSELQAGYVPKPGLLPSLDRTNGFRLQFTIQLIGEKHNTNDRAGFSVIALASDHYGIEIGFWSNRIWAQAGGGSGDGPRFTQSEGVPFDTTLSRTYNLEIRGATYILRSGATPILSGPLRNYSSAGLPYNLANMVFLGDDTTSAAAMVKISSMMLVPSGPLYQIRLPLAVR